MKRLLIFALLFGFALLADSAPAQDKKKLEELKKGLQALNEFVGEWNGDGKSGATKPKKESWLETLEWGWRFKGDDVWMTWKFKDGKVFKNADLRYIPDKKNFQLTAVDVKDQKVVYEGKVEKVGGSEYFTLDRLDPATKETQRLKINTAGDGVRLKMVVSHAGEGKKIHTEDYQVGYSMEGASLGAKAKKQECVVSGGLGTGTVTYKGMTYYVCCSGCRDAFNENPEFYVKAWEAKKGKK
jgi:hypothetical protein